VEELLQMQGFQARANVFGLGQVRLEPAAPAASGALSGPSAEAWQQALAQLRSALPQLRSLELSTPPAPARADASATGPSDSRLPTLPSAGAEPGKRIVALVSQGLPHLITADGARYFVGAVLPSGHRLVAVQPQALLLEREGRTSRIDF
jgi:type III secretion protein D